jgi:hypothetical protein
MKYIKTFEEYSAKEPALAVRIEQETSLEYQDLDKSIPEDEQESLKQESEREYIEGEKIRKAKEWRKKEKDKEERDKSLGLSQTANHTDPTINK